MTIMMMMAMMMTTIMMTMIMISMMMMMIIITVLSFIYIMYLFGIIHVIAHKSSPKHVRHGCFDFFIITNKRQSKIDIVFTNLTRSTDLITTRERSHTVRIYSGFKGENTHALVLHNFEVF